MKLFRTDLPKPSVWPPPRESGRVHAALEYARLRDPIGNHVHRALAALHLFTLPLNTAGSGITFAILAFYALIRLPNTWRAYPALLRRPVLWTWLAFVGWYALSMLWSDHPAQGWDEVGAMRMLALPLLLWPVLDHLVVFIGAALLGVLVQHGAQAAQLLGFMERDPEQRLNGLLHPIQTAAWCSAAMCWYLSAAMLGRGWLRIISLLGLALGGLGLVATQSRGPWIAAAIALPITLLIIALRRPDTRRIALGLTVAGLVGAIGLWLVAGDMIDRRVRTAITEIDQAVNDEIHWTSTGLRIGLWTWASDIWLDHPLVGAGAGSFAIEAAARPGQQHAITRGYDLARRDFDDPDDAERIGGKRRDYITRDHAHSTYLHTLAGTGLVGGALLLLALGLTLRNAWRDRPDHPFVPGTIGVMIIWLIGACFDCYHLNGHLLGMLALLVALTLPQRPRPNVDLPQLDTT